MIAWSTVRKHKSNHSDCTDRDKTCDSKGQREAKAKGLARYRILALRALAVAVIFETQVKREDSGADTYAETPKSSDSADWKYTGGKLNEGDL